MAEFTKERAGKPTPIVALPRGRTEGPRAVEVYLQFGRRPAGCLVCNTPIPPETTRLRVVARFPTEWLGPERQADQNPVTTQSYYVHPGCITDRIKPEVIRFGSDCYDCGAMPPKAENPRSFEKHPYRCFTVSKFAPGRLCGECIKKPRWRACTVCEMLFPQWMVSRVVSQPANPVDLDPFSQNPDVANGKDVCTFCALRFNLVTQEQAAESRSEYERLRQEILDQGVFDAGEPG